MYDLNPEAEPPGPRPCRISTISSETNDGLRDPSTDQRLRGLG